MDNTVVPGKLQWTQKMTPLLFSSTKGGIQIPLGIKRNFTKGFDHHSGVYTLSFLRKQVLRILKYNCIQSKPLDSTGLEHSVNEVAFTREDHESHLLLAAQVAIFVLRRWAESTDKIVLRAILLTSHDLTQLWFHVVRATEPYLDDDLDSYDQPMFVCDSNVVPAHLDELLQMVAAKVD